MNSKARPSGGGLWRLLLPLLLAAWLLRSLIVAPFSIPSGSMLPTLRIGDYLLVAKWPYGYSRASFLFGVPPIDGRLFARLPERGDIVIFRGPAGNDVIKRVIGLPGDEVAVDQGRVVLNGRVVRRTALGDTGLSISANSPCQAVVAPRRRGNECLFPAFRETLPNGRSFVVLDQGGDLPGDDMVATRIPPNSLFVMGDNRDDSADSRFAVAEGGMGFVPIEAVVGRALVTFWSTDGSASWIKPWSWFEAARWDRLGKGLGA